MFNHKLNFKKYTRCLMAMGMSVLGCIGTVDGTMAYAQEIDDGPVIGDLTLLPEEDLTKVPVDGLGSIALQLTDSMDGLPKENVKFNIIQVATVENGCYQLVDRFKDTQVDLNQIQNANELDAASSKLHAAWRNEKDKSEKSSEKVDAESAKNSMKQDSFAEETELEKTEFQDEIIKTDAEGVAKAEKLPIGVYLVSVNDPSQYEVIKPFVVAIPTWSDTDEVFQYDVTVEPKHSSLPHIAVNKVNSETEKAITNKHFEFTMYSDSDCKNKVQTAVGNQTTGVADFLVHYGTYYIKETKAPEKYILSDEMVKVTFTEDGFYINDKKVDLGENNTYSFIYKNKPIEEINTGVKTPIVQYGLAACGAALVIAILVKSRKKKE